MTADYICTMQDCRQHGYHAWLPCLTTCVPCVTAMQGMHDAWYTCLTAPIRDTAPYAFWQPIAYVVPSPAAAALAESMNGGRWGCRSQHVKCSSACGVLSDTLYYISEESGLTTLKLCIASNVIGFTTHYLRVVVDETTIDYF